MAPIGVGGALRRGGRGFGFAHVSPSLGRPPASRGASKRMAGGKGKPSKSQQSKKACKAAASEEDKLVEYERLLRLQDLYIKVA